MKILVNTISTKKHAGGAFQIAFNFMVKTLDHDEVEWEYVVSSDLDEVLPEVFKEKTNYHVFPTQPDFRHSYNRVKKELRALENEIHPNVVYSITAPSYFSFNAVEVMRFTNPWVTHPNKYSWATMSMVNRLRTRLYCWNQRRMMRKTSYFVTQTETTKKGIMRITGVPQDHVAVVNNVLPAFFIHQDNTHIDNNSGWIEIACVGAPVPHKNFDIIPEVLLELKKMGVDNIRFHTTIPIDSPAWKKISADLKNNHLELNVQNHGRVSQSELTLIYRRCSFCFLPTLLEVFSASTLEGMFFNLPIVATDFDFNRDVMDDACLYYKPKNAKDAAEQFVRLINDMELRETLTLRMKKQLAKYDDYDKHFNSILSFLKHVAEILDL